MVVSTSTTSQYYKVGNTQQKNIEQQFFQDFSYVLEPKIVIFKASSHNLLDLHNFDIKQPYFAFKGLKFSTRQIDMQLIYLKIHKLKQIGLLVLNFFPVATQNYMQQTQPYEAQAAKNCPQLPLARLVEYKRQPIAMKTGRRLFWLFSNWANISLGQQTRIHLQAEDHQAMQKCLLSELQRGSLQRRSFDQIICRTQASLTNRNQQIKLGAEACSVRRHH